MSNVNEKEKEERVEEDNSIWSNFKNKVTYNVHKATFDASANTFIKERESKKKEVITENKDKSTESLNQESNTTKFSAKRLISKIGNQTLEILKSIFFPFLSLMLAMIVTNEMIIYSAPIRLIFFIFTFLICYFLKFPAIILLIFYLLKGGYSYYVNNMTNRPKKDIMPTIFALLPLTTYTPSSSFTSFFMYPFTYPKTELDAIKLPEIMKNYWGELQSSTNTFNDIKNLPVFINGIKNAENSLLNLHDKHNQSKNE
jgi:hypothetical protein